MKSKLNHCSKPRRLGCQAVPLILKTASRLSRWGLFAVLLLAGAWPPAALAAPDTTPPRILILQPTVAPNSTVALALTSREAVAALAIPGFAVDVVDATQWAAMTATTGAPYNAAKGFSAYRGLVIGDPNCNTGAADYLTALGILNTSQGAWGPAVTGNIILMGVDNALHAGGPPGAQKLLERGIQFTVADPAGTGFYYALSCYYDYTAPAPPNTPVPHLNNIGGSVGAFKVRDFGGVCFQKAHIVASHAIFTATPPLVDADLSNWGCSVHEGFDAWPANFVVLAIAETNNAAVYPYVATDGTRGVPYILVRGTNVTPIGGCLTITNRSVECIGTNNTYAWSFCITNQFTNAIQYLSFPDLPAGVTINSDILLLNPALQPGQGTCRTLYLTNTGTATNFCFTIGVIATNFVECCSTINCLTLVPCCTYVTNEVAHPIPGQPNCYAYSLTIKNVSQMYVGYVFLTPDPFNCLTFTPDIFNVSTLAPNQTTVLNTTLCVSPSCAPPRCFYVTLWNTNLTECCSTRHCVDLTNCCTPRTYTLDADFDEGTTVNLNHNPAHNQLQLNPVAKPFPYVNVACSTRGTAVRIDVNTGTVLGEYLTSPNGMGRQPSRTTVDKFGNVWVANRAEYSESPAASGNFKGSVVRIGLIIGGTRVNANGTPNTVGQYLKPPYIYNTCIDRDSDGLIKTSKGLADILPWLNTFLVDSDGGVSTAEDEAISIYTRVNGTGTRFIGIDCDNNVWTGGNGDQDFQMLDGFTGLPVPGFAFNIGSGGYGGLIDGNGNLWGANKLMRFVPNPGTPPGAGVTLPYYVYGLGINPLNCHVFASSARKSDGTANYGLAEFDSAGNVVNAYPAIGSGGGLCVDGNGHIWVTQGIQIAHLKPSGSGHVLVGYITTDNSNIPFQFVWGAAVDSNGQIWATDAARNMAVRIDPTLATGLGAVDLVVPLGTNAYPYNYSDMTGFVELAATCRSGFWSIIHDGCAPGNPWGKLSWNSSEPPGTSIKVEFRAADAQGNLPLVPWMTANNGANFCGTGVQGRFLEVRVSFNGPGCSTNSPILYDLTVECCSKASNHPPNVVQCPGPFSFPNSNGPVTFTMSATFTDADGDQLTVTWSEGATTLQTDNVPGGFPSATSATLNFTHSFPPGNHVIVIAVDDGSGKRAVCDVSVKVGDHTPPVLTSPAGVAVVAFTGVLPSFISGPIAVDDTTPPEQIVLNQTPSAGLVVSQGVHVVEITARDLAGNTSTGQTFFAVNPVVEITSPANYAVFPAPATINVAATIASNVTGVASVRLLNGGAVVGTDNAAPYSFVVSNLPAGGYILTAQAVSTSNVVSTSDGVVILVGSAGGPAGAPVLLNPGLNGSNLRFSMQTAPGVTYQVEYSDSITSPNWQPLDIIVGDGGVSALSYSRTNSQRFYRVRTQ